MSSPTAPPAPEPRNAARSLLHGALRSGLFVAICAAAFAWETSRIAGVAPQPPRFYAFLFLATWASYRLHSLRPRAGVGPRTVATTWAIFAGVALLLPTLPPAMWPAIALLALLAWAYSRPAWPGLRRLREFGLAKILTLAGVWTIATTLLPIVDRPLATTTVVLLIVRRFLFMFTLCVAFDVRDHLVDARAGIRTLPVRLGVSRSFALMRLTLAAFVLLVCLGPLATREPFGPIEAALVLSALATWIAVEASRRGRSTWFYLGFVDGMMLLQAALVWVLLWTTGR